MKSEFTQSSIYLCQRFLLVMRSWCHYEGIKCFFDVLNHFSHVGLFAIPWTVAHQASLSMRYSGQEYWSGLSCPPPWDGLHPGIIPVSPVSPALQMNSLPLSHQRRSPFEIWGDEKIGFLKSVSENNYLKTFPASSLSPLARVPHSWSPPCTPFRGCWRSAAAVAPELILVEVDDNCP